MLALKKCFVAPRTTDRDAANAAISTGATTELTRELALAKERLAELEAAKAGAEAAALEAAARERSSAAAERDAVAALHGKATRDQLRSAMDAAFETIDADDDGTLAVAELKDAGLDPVLVARLDLDKDGALSRSEFVDAIVSSAFPSEGEPTHKSETLVRLVQQAVATVLRRRHSEAMAEAKAAAKAEAEAAAAAAQQELAAAKQALDAEKAEVASARASQGASSARDEAVARELALAKERLAELEAAKAGAEAAAAAARQELAAAKRAMDAWTRPQSDSARSGNLPSRKTLSSPTVTTVGGKPPVATLTRPQPPALSASLDKLCNLNNLLASPLAQSQPEPSSVDYSTKQAPASHGGPAMRAPMHAPIPTPKTTPQLSAEDLARFDPLMKATPKAPPPRAAAAMPATRSTVPPAPSNMATSTSTSTQKVASRPPSASIRHDGSTAHPPTSHSITSERGGALPPRGASANAVGSETHGRGESACDRLSDRLARSLSEMDRQPSSAPSPPVTFKKGLFRSGPRLAREP